MPELSTAQTLASPSSGVTVVGSGLAARRPCSGAGGIARTGAVTGRTGPSPVLS